MIIVSTIGRKRLLVSMLSAVDGATLKLFKNDVLYDSSPELVGFEEADFIGYSPVVLNGTWKILDGKATYPKQLFVATASQNEQQIYGYFIEKDEKLLFWEVFDEGSVSVSLEGDLLAIALQLEVQEIET